MDKINISKAQSNYDLAQHFRDKGNRLWPNADAFNAFRRANQAYALHLMRWGGNAKPAGFDLFQKSCNER